MNRNPGNAPSRTASRLLGPSPPQLWVTAATVTFVALAVFAATFNTGTFVKSPDALLHLPLLSHAKHVPTIFSQHFMAFTDGRYRPLPYALIALVRTFVSADNVLFWQSWLVAFHVINALLVYMVARHFTDHAGPALVALGVFVLHPMASVFGSQIDLFPLVLAGSFYLGSFLCYLHYVHRHDLLVYLLALILFVGGLLSSHVLLTLPVLILLYELLYARTGIFRTIGRLLPFGLCAALAGHCFLTFHPHLIYYVYPPKPYAGVPRYWMHSFSSGGLDALVALARGWSTRAPVTALLGKMHEAWRPASVLAGAALGVWVIVSLLALLRRQWLAVGTFLLLLAVLPRFAWGQNLTTDYVSWTYRYLPFAGFALLLGAALEALLSVGNRWWQRGVIAAAVIGVTAYGALLVAANLRARSPESYWRHALAVNPRSEIASVQLGKVYLAEGNETEAKKLLFSPMVHNVRESCVVMARHYSQKGNPLAAAIHVDLASREKEYGLVHQDVVPATAEMLHRMEAFDFVEQFLGASLMANPHNTAALTRLAEVLATKGFLRAAIVYAQGALDIRSDDKNAARLLLDLKKRFYEPETSATVTRASPPEPGLLRYINSQGITTGTRKAIMALTGTTPDDPIIQVIGSIFLAESGQTEQALAAVDRALASLSSYPFARTTKCWVAQKAGRMDLAIQAAGQARELTPRDAEMWYTVGWKRAEAGQHELGIACLRTALRANPCLPGIHVDIGALLARQGKYLEALRYYRRGLALTKGENELLYAGMGYVLRRLGEFDEAIAYLRKAIAADPKQPAPYRHTAKCFEDQGRFAESIEVLSEGLKEVPEDPGLQSDLAAILSTAPEADLRDGQRAVRLAQAACRETDPVTPELLDVLAAAYAEIGRFNSAVATAREAASLARSQGNAVLARRIDQRRQLYQMRRPLRLTPPKQPD